jgi:lipid-binding SYLF domain-containing protein
VWRRSPRVSRCRVRDKDREDLAKKMVDAREVYQELLNTADHEVPDALRKNAKCIAVIPHTLKGASAMARRAARV